MRLNIFAVLFLLLGASTAFAIPAKRTAQTITQPDGTTVKVKLTGDEFAHYYIGEDGTPMDFDSNGTLRYIKADAAGNIIFSPMAATDIKSRDAAAKEFIRTISTDALALGIEKRSAEARLQRNAVRNIRKAAAKAAQAVPQYGMGLFTSNYPRTGEVRSLVLLVEYTDVKFRTPDPLEFFTNMLNKEGFSEYGGTGSARDYFLEQSHENFRPQFDVYGPVLLPNKMAYYGENRYGQDMRPEQMVLHAAEILQHEIDFSIYDYDNDGQVDNIYVIYAGLGENSGGSASSVWPHSFQIENGPVYNGKQIYAYACSNEITDGKPEGIGTFCHEYSHVLGLPDLYSTAGSLSCTPAEWSVMDYGSYNNDSRTPPNYSIFERNALGWAEPIVADGPETVVLEAIHKSNNAYLIQTQQTNEFFLIENRQQEGWDEYIPGHGMLLWHIDFDQIKWDQNIVNNNRNHQYVDIVEANGRTGTSESVLAGYPFPGTSGNTSITRNTSPALKDWNGTGIDMPITDITETDGVISFNILGGAVTVPTPEKPELTAGEQGDITAKWNAVEGATSYLVSLYTRDADNKAAFVGEYENYNVGNVVEFTFSGLQSTTEYFCTVSACIGRNVSEASEEASVTTPEIDFIYTAPTADVCEVNGNTATLGWGALEGAVAYLVNAEYEELDEDIENIIGFGESDDTELTIPEGWSWSGDNTSGYFGISTGFYGEEAPALKFETNNAALTSPEIDLDIKSVSFWVRGASTAAASKLDVQGRFSAEDSWRTIKLFEGLNIYNARGTTLSVDIPKNIHQLNFVYTTSRGSIAFDDLKIVTSGYVYVQLAEGVDVGNALSHIVQFPESATGVRFNVTGVDKDGRLSQASNTLYAKVDGSGQSNTILTDVTQDSSSLHVEGRTISYYGSEGDVLSVYTITGALAAEVRAGADCRARTELPQGFYIVRTPGGSHKINLR